MFAIAAEGYRGRRPTRQARRLVLGKGTLQRPRLAKPRTHAGLAVHEAHGSQQRPSRDCEGHDPDGGCREGRDRSGCPRQAWPPTRNASLDRLAELIAPAHSKNLALKAIQSHTIPQGFKGIPWNARQYFYRGSSGLSWTSSDSDLLMYVPVNMAACCPGTAPG